MSAVTPTPRPEAPESSRESRCWFSYPSRQLVQTPGVAKQVRDRQSGASDSPASTAGECWFRSPLPKPPIASTAVASVRADSCAVSAATAHGSAVDSEHTSDDSDSADEEVEGEEGEEGEEGGADGVRPENPQLGKLWGSAQYPEGCKNDYACWDWANILAAQEWCCPCRDRRNCIGRERMRPEELLWHRKEYQTTRPTNR
jgi:hypothetical protein